MAFTEVFVEVPILIVAVLLEPDIVTDLPDLVLNAMG